MSAQALGVVTGTVRSESGVVLSDVRVRITAPNIDTVIRTSVRGTFMVRLPEGRAHFALTRIGYAPNDGDVIVSKSISVRMQMRQLPHQLSAVDVRDQWIGIRGIVGDDSTMVALTGVTIRSGRRSINVVTDSQGRFEISLPKRERTSLIVSRDGYLTKPMIVPLDTANTADITVLMKRGADPIQMKSIMVDLDHRMNWGGIGMFVLDHEKLIGTGETYVGAAIAQSGMVVRKGVSSHYAPGVLLNGLPSTSDVLFDLKVADVEFIEYWGVNTDFTRTLVSRWGGGIGTKGGGPWISIWLRR